MVTPADRRRPGRSPSELHVVAAGACFWKMPENAVEAPCCVADVGPEQQQDVEVMLPVVDGSQPTMAQVSARANAGEQGIAKVRIAATSEVRMRAPLDMMR
jgi:hypothetical protein